MPCRRQRSSPTDPCENKNDGNSADRSAARTDDVASAGVGWCGAGIGPIDITASRFAARLLIIGYSAQPINPLSSRQTIGQEGTRGNDRSECDDDCCVFAGGKGLWRAHIVPTKLSTQTIKRSAQSGAVVRLRHRVGRISARGCKKLVRPSSWRTAPAAGALLGNEAVRNSPKDGYNLGSRPPDSSSRR